MHKDKTYRLINSQCEWIGDVPTHWLNTKFKYLASLKKGKKSELDSDFPQEGFVPYLSMDYLRGNKEASLYVDERQSVVIQPGELLILWDGANAGEFFVSKAGALSSTLVLINLSAKVLKDFAYYLFQALQPIIQSETIGMGIPHVDGDSLKDQRIFLPPLNEQIIISTHLGDKISKIDKLINAKTTLSEKVDLKRSSIISEIITKGLTADNSTKSSKFDWIKHIPSHWVEKKLKYLVSKIGSGVTPQGGGESYKDDGIPLLRSQNIYNDGLRLDDVAFIDLETHDSMKGSQVFFGDVLLNITGASIGRCHYYEGESNMANVNQHVCIIRPNIDLIDYKFLHLVFCSIVGQEQIQRTYTGGNREGLTNGNLKELTILLPPLDEQIKIVKAINKKLNALDQVKSNLLQQLKILKSYRQAYITELVTGKINVIL